MLNTQALRAESEYRDAVRVLAVASGKGGVGKTNMAVNLALALARRGESVLLMDADLALANLDVVLGIRPRHDLCQVLSGELNINDIIIDGPHGIGIVPASSGVRRMAELSVAEHAGLIRAFDEVERHVDTLLIDTAAGLSESVVSFCRAANEVLVVVCDEPASLTDAYALIKVLGQEHGVRRFQVVCNMVQDAAHGRQLYAKLARVAEHYLADVALGYLGAVPFDERLKQAVRQQRALMQQSPYSASGLAFQQLAERVTVLPRQAVAPGYFEFFANRCERRAAMEGTT